MTCCYRRIKLYECLDCVIVCGLGCLAGGRNRLHADPSTPAEILVEVAKLVFWFHCIILGVVHIKDGLLERGNVLSGNLQSPSGMFCLPNVGVGGAMDMFRDGCVASETVFVEDKLGH